MDIFEFEDYKKYTLNRFHSLPKRGYGQQRKLAEHLQVSTTFISQVLQTDKSFNLEQAVLVCEFLGLTEMETNYFLKLVQLERAGSYKLKTILKKDLLILKQQSQKVAHRLKNDKKLSDEQRAIFYSDWFYSGIRLLTGIKGFQELEDISQHFGLPRKVTADAIHFLLDAGLVIEQKGKLHVGPSKTFLESESSFAKLNHSNWRNKAIQNMQFPYEEKLHFTSPLTISIKDAEKVKLKILKLIEETGKIVGPSKPEELMCLNIDWFKVNPK